ncbi:hypothetical protein K402DRAFT_250117 [Aulographum hederae CBS 113979]|uniref:Uncharacterized protein n=1 Tax=Aulographum hederae CBS 113979 TaxID=1176131 RepID=A0A6G1GJP0_9PEZI|nr:hypothetical protein K402DRAFT_250117 [Aulographum hederae CBS 113979]
MFRSDRGRLLMFHGRSWSSMFGFVIPLQHWFVIEAIVDRRRKLIRVLKETTHLLFSFDNTVKPTQRKCEPG